MFTGLGQYEAGAAEASGGDVWTGSVYDPGATPAKWTTEWVASQPSNSIKSEGILPILQNVVSGAANVLGSYLQMTGAKEQAKTAVAAGTKSVVTTTPTAQTAGFNLGGNLPILGILAIGAFLVLRKGKGAPEKRKRRS